MAFSQSFSLGDNTLNQLDVVEMKVPCISKNVSNRKPTTPKNSKRSEELLNRKSMVNVFGNQSPTIDASNSNILDIIDESPTEKTNVLGKSIRERLKNASTSKKYDRKYMRRSRSDPITASDSKRSSLSSTYQKHGFTENFGSMFDSTIEWDEPDDCERKTPKLKLDEKFEDDFDKYLENIQTPGCAQRRPDDDKTKDNSLISLNDSGDIDYVNVSEIVRLMQTEKFDKSVNSSAPKTEPDEIQWDDSAFFNDLLASQQKSNHEDATKNENSQPEIAMNAEYISMHSVRNEAIDDEMESCFLEVSMQLSDLNAIETKPPLKNGTQLDSSILSRSIRERSSSVSENVRLNNESNQSTIAWRHKQSIDYLREWSCSAPIIKAYKKNGIENMFEWQVECLSNPKVIFSY